MNVIKGMIFKKIYPLFLVELIFLFTTLEVAFLLISSFPVRIRCCLKLAGNPMMKVREYALYHRILSTNQGTTGCPNKLGN